MQAFGLAKQAPEGLGGVGMDAGSLTDFTPCVLGPSSMTPGAWIHAVLMLTVIAHLLLSMPMPLPLLVPMCAGQG